VKTESPLGGRSDARQSARWKPWDVGYLINADFPAFALRTYLKHADVRAILQCVTAGRRLGSACEVGCGYGRMTVVLGEFADRVEGFERQPEFVALARRLHPGIAVRQVAGLSAFPRRTAPSSWS
jgi:hypothetical protein